MVTVYCRDPEQPALESVAVIVKVNIPCVVGVPVSCPEVESINPSGSVPPETLKV